MSDTYSEKKSASADWHRADIKAALEKAGWTLRKLSVHYRYSVNSLRGALHFQWPEAEKIIARTIGVPPAEIWPSRYHPDGTSTRTPSRRGNRRKALSANDTGTADSDHVNVPGAG